MEDGNATPKETTNRQSSFSNKRKRYDRKEKRKRRKRRSASNDTDTNLSCMRRSRSRERREHRHQQHRSGSSRSSDRDHHRHHRRSSSSRSNHREHHGRRRKSGSSRSSQSNHRGRHGRCSRSGSSRSNRRQDSRTAGVRDSRNAGGRGSGSCSRSSRPRKRSCSPVRRSNTDNVTHLLLTKLVNTLVNTRPEGNKFPMLGNVIPDFDPMVKGQTIQMWLSKVDECAKLYKWGDDQVIHYALPKLVGVAKTWYQALPTMSFSWPE